jgi:hypothetical protein
VQVERELETKLRAKDAELSEHRNAIESVSTKAQEDLISQKRHYEEKIINIETRHTHELKSMN